MTLAQLSLLIRVDMGAPTIHDEHGSVGDLLEMQARAARAGFGG